MKILIAYDGSESADKGLITAGLPVEADALVVSVAEVWLPPPPRDFDDTFPLQIPVGLKRARAHAAQIVKDARDLAERGSKRLQYIFPRGTVSQEALKARNRRSEG